MVVSNYVTFVTLFLILSNDPKILSSFIYKISRVNMSSDEEERAGPE
jgi:hypothetical protein